MRTNPRWTNSCLCFALKPKSCGDDIIVLINVMHFTYINIVRLYAIRKIAIPYIRGLAQL